ncbi:MAG: alpha/beta hydrolase, partial [Pseudomonadota bacterium]|nr:alpha/beta hydrolase [Pseudomonadota bacterium]
MASIAPAPGSIVVEGTDGVRRSPTRQATAPNRFWTFAEGRAMFEFASFYAMRPLLSTLPKGDGHSVLVLPGFMATNSSTAPMRNLLSELGYDAHGWDSGRNVRVNEELVDKLESQIERLYKESGRKISLVGWSLGGVLARELAKLKPDHFRFQL